MTIRPEQIPLDLPHDPARGRDDLLVFDRMRDALALVDAWPRWRSPVIMLVGPPGSGKSHLAAIWRERSRARALTPSDADTAAGRAAEGPVLVEDAERAGFSDDMLFHLINSVRENATSMLMTARRLPAAWDVRLPDLASRLKAVTVAEIGPPDEETLAGVMVKLFADRQLVVDPRVLSYLTARMERSFEAANSLVERLDRLALARGTPVSRALAAEVLGAGGESD
ncbi:DnaA regulatory inactivator HdaA [Ensifer soli]|uniref:DnaA regulatory inactivator HdaA n=1 Tax=Ciceribacter sp. sgz301302 TaxID=3342379 RepID=UPI0035B84EC8